MSTMNTDLDDTGELLGVAVLPRPAVAAYLDEISHAVVTKAALLAKADAYDKRLARALKAAHDAGVIISDLADSAGITADDVHQRLAAAKLVGRAEGKRWRPPLMFGRRDGDLADSS